MDYKFGLGNAQFVSLATGQPIEKREPPLVLEMPPLDFSTVDMTAQWSFASISQQQFDALHSLMRPTATRLILCFAPAVSLALRRKAWRHWGVIAHWDKRGIDG